MTFIKRKLSRGKNCSLKNADNLMELIINRTHQEWNEIVIEINHF